MANGATRALAHAHGEQRKPLLRPRDLPSSAQWLLSAQRSRDGLEAGLLTRAPGGAGGTRLDLDEPGCSGGLVHGGKMELCSGGEQSTGQTRTNSSCYVNEFYLKLVWT